MILIDFLKKVKIRCWTIPFYSDKLCRDLVVEGGSRPRLLEMTAMHASRFELTQAPVLNAHAASLASGFVVCPVALRPNLPGPQEWVHEIYRVAYENARRALEPTWYDRVIQPSLN